MTTSRRTLLKSIVAGATAAPFSLLAASSTPSACHTPRPTWPPGVEGQRKADLGNGTFLNPIVSGDHPDPTILKDGDDYYMTFSSFYSYPGLIIWHSKDLVNWAPIGPTLTTSLGVIWAVDLCKHDDRYFIYIPADPKGEGWSIYAIWADDIKGPWSEPVNLHIDGCIDPGHIVGEDGRRYLFVNGIRKIRLTDDGLATDGELEMAYDPWRYPNDWIVENFAPEGPKLFRHKNWFYLVTAVGGTAGPVTGHMVIAARSKSIHGPWEHCPHNPLVRTQSEQEPWWSKGHATVVQGPEGDWWMVYHGYENGFRTLGRQTLLEPIEWRDDGWFYATGGDLSKPLPKPTRTALSSSGFALSDDFSQNKFGIQWSFHNPRPEEMARVRYSNKALLLAAHGSSPADSAPLTCPISDRAYEVEIAMTLSDNTTTEAGILLFYNHKAYVGLGFTQSILKLYQYSEELKWAGRPIDNREVRFKLTNNRHVVTYHYSFDNGKTWHLHGTRMEVSGMHHNVFGGFLSLKVALYCTGEGSVTLRDFQYRAIEETL